MTKTKYPLSPATLSVAEFLASRQNLSLFVPRYQRAYAWGKEEVQNLLHDIDAAMSGQSKVGGSPYYFIGALLCIQHEKSNSNVRYEIVDGQQRLTTINLIYAHIYHWIKGKNPNEIRKKTGVSYSKIESGLLPYLFLDSNQGAFQEDPPLNERTCRLQLGDKDKMAFSQIIKNGPTTRSNTKTRKLSEAYSVIADFFQDKIERDKGKAKYVVDFIKFLSEQVVMVEVVISDEANAYEIFESFNDRNMRLTAVDLIKNKLLSCQGSNEQEITAAYNLWQDTFAVGCGERPSSMQEYVRCHLQMIRGTNIAPKLLYRDLRKFLGNSSQSAVKKRANNLLLDLHSNCHKFKAILCRDDRFWEHFNSDIKPFVGYLNDYRVVYTLMFAFLHVGTKTDMVLNAYHMLSSFMRRTRAVRERFSIMEYYEYEFAVLAKKIMNKKGPKSPKNFFAELKRIDSTDGWKVIPNESFVAQMSQRSKFRDTDAKLILLQIANHIQRDNQLGSVVDTSVHTLEHIFPQTPKFSEWPNWNEDQASLHREAIGNLTILQGARNTSASNKKFADKKRIAYSKQKCGLRITNDLCKHSKWTPTEVKKRSVKLAEIAAEIWSFEYWDR